MPKETFMKLSNEKKKRILIAAKKEFSRVSLEEASINNIITDAGIARGSFYQYFESKQDLLEFMQRAVKEKLQKTIKDKLDESGDIFSSFICFYDEIMKIVKDEENRKFYKTILVNLRANEGIVLGNNYNKSKIYQYILKNTDTSKFEKPEDLSTIIEMLNAITRWSIIQTVLLNNKSALRKSYVRQINYLKKGVLRKEKKC